MYSNGYKLQLDTYASARIYASQCTSSLAFTVPSRISGFRSTRDCPGTWPRQRRPQPQVQYARNLRQIAVLHPLNGAQCGSR